MISNPLANPLGHQWNGPVKCTLWKVFTTNQKIHPSTCRVLAQALVHAAHSNHVYTAGHRFHVQLFSGQSLGTMLDYTIIISFLMSQKKNPQQNMFWITSSYLL